MAIPFGVPPRIGACRLPEASFWSGMGQKVSGFTTPSLKE